MVEKVIAVPPEASMPFCTRSLKIFKLKCPGVAFVYELTTATKGFDKTSSVNPIDLYSALFKAP